MKYESPFCSKRETWPPGGTLIIKISRLTVPIQNSFFDIFPVTAWSKKNCLFELINILVLIINLDQLHFKNASFMICVWFWSNILWRLNWLKLASFERDIKQKGNIMKRRNKANTTKNNRSSDEVGNGPRSNKWTSCGRETLSASILARSSCQQW